MSSRDHALLIVLFGILAWSSDATADAAVDKSASEERGASALFGDAANQFKQGEYAKALTLFTRVAELNDSPNVELYIGYCHMELGSDLDAHRAFSRVVHQSVEIGDPKYAAARQAAQERIATLNLRLAKLTISLAEDAKAVAVRLDAERLNDADIGSPIVVNPGAHRIIAESSGKRPIVRDVVLEKGSSKTVTLMFEKSEAPPSSPLSDVAPPATKVPRSTPWTTYGIAAAGVGLAGLGVFAVAGYRTRSAYDRLETECANGCSDPIHRDLVRDGKTYQTLANVGLATAIVGTAAGAALIYLGLSSSETAQPGVAVGAGFVHVTCEGRF